jgi:prepilin-type N-terminal cleavage/methylation domain-containing protein
MKAKSRQSGLTLVEMTTVIAIVALLTAFAIPAVRTLFNSLGSAGSVKGMISAALASARAIAAKEQRYVGVRFQQDLEGHQYMVFVINDPEATGLAWGFCAVEGIQPVKLPDNIGVMDLTIVTDRRTGTFNYNEIRLDDPFPTVAQRNIYIDEDFELTDTTTFSIIFSSTGKMVLHDVRTRNRDGDYRPMNLNDSMDDVFNSPENIKNNNTGMFVQDDYFGNNSYPADMGFGLGPEISRRSFVIYDKIQFAKVDPNRRWTDYLRTLEVIYINPYTGTIVSVD